ncbi:MAG: CHAT domain-containing protein [Deltaproteobacteria bacterium]|nr:CHAT domain-containing protein [Deltaproteobacteria bacterium]
MGRRALGLSLLLSASCLDPAPAEPGLELEDEAQRYTPTQILSTGCAAALDPHRCELGDGPLVVWLPGDPEDGRWHLDGAPVLPTHVEPALDGTRLTFTLEPLTGGEHRLELLDPTGETEWELALQPDPLPAARRRYEAELAALRHSPDMRARLELAERLLVQASSATRLERLARIRDARLLSHDTRDDASSATTVQALLDRTVSAAMSIDRWEEACEATAIGLFLATHTWSLDRIVHWERGVEPCRQRSARWDAALGYYLGVVRLRQGRYSDAARELARARRGAARLGLPHELPARKRQVELLMRTSRWSEARRELEALARYPATGCVKASLDSEIGFSLLLARQRSDVDLGDPRVALRRALSSHERGGACERVGMRNHDRIKLGLAAAQYGDSEAVGRTIASIDPETLNGKFRTQYQELRVLDALERRRLGEAREALVAMASTLPHSPEPSARWRLAMLAADVARAERDAEAEFEALRDAEAVLDEIRWGVTSDAVRDRWLNGYRRSATGLVERLIERGRVEQAACAARSARGRALALHDLSATQPPSSVATLDRRAVHAACPRPWSHDPDELVVLLFPRLDDGWWMFEIRDDVQRVHAVGALPYPDDERVDPRWWDRWSSSLESASAVRVLASGEAYGVPFHRLGWRGAPLASRRAVVYGLDLATPSTDTPTLPLSSPSALLVFADVDPLRSLERYAPSVAEVDAMLSADGWQTEWLERDDVDLVPRTLREHLSSVTLLHYYGHGDRSGIAPDISPSLSDDLGTTALVLDEGTRFGVDDVFALPHAPRWAVLLGCQLGYSDLHGWSGGLSLAHAFLLAGTEQVIASTDALDAAAAAELGARLHARRPGEPFDLSRALHHAWSSHYATSTDEPPWKDLRVWSR